MKCISIFLISLIVGLFMGCLTPQVKVSGKESNEAADKAAAKSLKTFRKLITEQNYRQMGFDSLDEVKNATLDNSIQEYTIELASLKEYRNDDDPGKLLIPTHSLVYSVLVNGEARTSITMSFRDHAWKAYSFGYSNFTKLLVSQLNMQSKNQKLPRSAFFIVRVPAFNLVFLGYRISGKFMLAPVVDAPDYKLNAGIPVPANIVLTKLRPTAGSYDDLPR